VSGDITLGVDANGDPIPYRLALTSSGDGDGAQGVPAWRREELDYRTPKIAQGSVTSASLPTQVGDSHEVNSWASGLGVSAQQPGQATTGYRYTEGGDAASGSFVRASPAKNEVAISSSSGVGHLVEYKSELYAGAGRTFGKINSSGIYSDVYEFDSGSLITGMVVYRGDQDDDYLFLAVSGAGGYYVYDGTDMTQDTEVTTEIPDVTEFTTNDGITYTEDDTAPFTVTLNSMNTLANGDWLIVGWNQDFNGLRFDIDDANGNAATMAVHYWSGAAWTAVTNLTDGTASGGATLAVDGSVTWDPITDMGTTVINDQRIVPVRVTVSAALDSSVSTTDIFVIRRSQASKFAAFTDASNSAGAKLFRAHKYLGRPAVSTSLDGGTSATWGGTLTFGDQGEVITNIHAINSRVLVETDRDIYSFTRDFTSLVQALRPEDHDFSSTNNGVGSKVLEGVVFLSRQNGLVMYNPEVVDQANMLHVGLETLPENDTPVSGRTTAITFDGYYVIAAVYNGADTYINRMPMALEGQSRRWQSWLKLAGVQCDVLQVSDVVTNTKRLYYGRGGDLGYVELPRFGHDPAGENETTTAYTTSFKVYVPRTITDTPQHDTNWLRIGVLGDDIDATHQVEIWYRSSASSTWSSLGTLSAAGYKNLPEDLDATWVDTHLVCTATASQSPAIRSVAVEFRKATPYFRVFEYAIDMAATVTSGGIWVNRTREDIANTLDTLVAARDLVRHNSPEGQRFKVFVRDLGVTPLQSAAAQNAEAVRYIECIEYLQLDTSGTWDDLESFSWTSLDSYTWDELDEVKAA